VVRRVPPFIATECETSGSTIIHMHGGKQFKGDFMTRRNAIIRLVSLFIALLAVWGQSLTAQTLQCPCGIITLKVDSDVACSVTICYQLSPLGPIACRAVAPGGSTTVPCPLYALGIRLCDGSIHWIIQGTPLPPVGACTPTLTLARGCCVRACRALDDTAMCPVFEIKRAPCSTTDC